MTQELLMRSITNLSVAIASIFTLLLSGGRLEVAHVIVGLILLLLLLAYGGHGAPAQTRIERFVSSALLGLCSLLALGWLLVPLSQALFSLSDHFYFGALALPPSDIVIFIFWLLVTLIWTRIHPPQHWPKLFQPAGH